ncbi:MAG: hypothetical protein LCH76_00760 [Actinobacteria bacterium]|nr:hypothetical protein [Actinomycetota bacterium]
MAKPGIWPAVVACLFAGALLAPPSAIPHAGSEQAGSGVGQPAAPGRIPALPLHPRPPAELPEPRPVVPELVAPAPEPSVSSTPSPTPTPSPSSQALSPRRPTTKPKPTTKPATSKPSTARPSAVKPSTVKPSTAKPSSRPTVSAPKPNTTKRPSATVKPAQPSKPSPSPTPTPTPKPRPGIPWRDDDKHELPPIAIPSVRPDKGVDGKTLAAQKRQVNRSHRGKADRRDAHAKHWGEGHRSGRDCSARSER